MSTVVPCCASSIASPNSARRRLTWVGLKTRAGSSLFDKASRTNARPRVTIAEMQMQDAGLAGHHASDMALGGDSQQFVQRGLARAMIADRDFADADQRLDEHQVAAHAAGQRRGRHVIAAGVSVSIEPFFAQRIDRREQFTRTARDIVGTEKADDRRDPRGGERDSGTGGTRVRNPASPPPPVT